MTCCCLSTPAPHGAHHTCRRHGHTGQPVARGWSRRARAWWASLRCGLLGLGPGARPTPVAAASAGAAQPRAPHATRPACASAPPSPSRDQPQAGWGAGCGGGKALKRGAQRRPVDTRNTQSRPALTPLPPQASSPCGPPPGVERVARVRHRGRPRLPGRPLAAPRPRVRFAPACRACAHRPLTLPLSVLVLVHRGLPEDVLPLDDDEVRDEG